MEAYGTQNRSELLLDYKYRAANQTTLNRAFALMLAEQGLLSIEDYKKIDEGLVAVQNTLAEADMDPGKGDVYFIYEAALYEAIGMDTACKLHIGRSRNDIYFTLYRMSVREALWLIMDDLLETQRLLERKIEENLDTVIPYYTYGQPAQPGTWGHYLMTVHECFGNDLKRMKAAYENVNRSPMGAAAGIGTAFNLNKYRMAELLGFDSVIENTQFGNASVDYFLETEAAFAIMNSTLGRVGGDLMFFATSECKILNCDMSICGGSSIMPQKKNAEIAEIFRSQATLFPGYMMSSLMSAGGISLFPSRETYHFFFKFWEHTEALLTGLRLLRLILERSEINKEIALSRARDGFTAATAMAEELTMEVGEPFVKTHHVVGGMIHKLMDEGQLKVENMTGALMREASIKALGFEVIKSDEEIARMMDPLSSLEAKITGGTPKPADTAELLKAGRAIRIQNESWLAAAKKHVERAYAQIEKGIG